MRKISIAALSMFFVMQSCTQLNYNSISGNVTDGSEGSSSTISTIGSILGNILSSDNVELSQLVGTWNYSSPAVGFQSEDVLKSIGGSAASAAIEQELASYYQKLGFNNVVLTIDENATFTMKIKGVSVSGDVVKGENGIFVFNFKAFGAINLGKLDVYTTLSGKTLSLTCDAKKFVEMAKKVTAVTNNSTIQSIMTLLDSYDGITVGFKLKK